MKFSTFLISIFTLPLLSFQPQGHLSLTFKNDTKDDFKKLEVNVRGRLYYFSDIKSGATTKPISVESAYKYCAAKAFTAKDTLDCRGFCYVGETLFTDGRLLVTFKYNKTGMLDIVPDKRSR